VAHLLAKAVANHGDAENAARLYELTARMTERPKSLLEIDPAEVHREYAEVLDSLGRHAEAEQQRALAISRQTASAPERSTP
jgi:hypothetical protein